MIENEKAYRLGMQMCFCVNGDPAEADNLFIRDTPEWRSWNRGWNNALDYFL